MALEPSSASTAPVTFPTTVPGCECSGTESAWYWGLSFCQRPRGKECYEHWGCFK